MIIDQLELQILGSIFALSNLPVIVTDLLYGKANETKDEHDQALRILKIILLVYLVLNWFYFHRRIYAFEVIARESKKRAFNKLVLNFQNDHYEDDVSSDDPGVNDRMQELERGKYMEEIDLVMFHQAIRWITGVQ